MIKNDFLNYIEVTKIVFKNNQDPDIKVFIDYQKIGLFKHC